MIDIFDEATRKMIASKIRNESERIYYNQSIFSIMEGNMKSLLEKRMMDDLGLKSFSSARGRQAPINVFRKVIDKLTRIYQQTVVRSVQNGNDQDMELLQWYEGVLGINAKFGKNNENFNAYHYSLLHIGLKKPDDISARIYNPNMKQPFIRSIPNHQFIIINTSQEDPTSPDIIITFMEKRKDAKGRVESVYYVYTSEQFMIMNDQGEVVADLMLENEQDGNNPYGVAPFVYANNSEDNVMPEIQTDSIDMALLIPLLLTDLNYAVKFQAFSMFVAIDIEDKNIEISPNSILSFRSSPTGEKPSFDSIKPTVDIDQVLKLASSTMGLWLSSKGLRPSSIGGLSVDMAASGISKIIDEADTYEAIKKQIVIYERFEKNFWEKLLKVMHPQWVAAGIVENKTIFSTEARIVTRFSKPVPLQTRGDLVKDLEAEVLGGFTSVKRALSILNPEMRESEIDMLISEVEAERPKIIAMQAAVKGNSSPDGSGGNDDE
jgi:hypothetical protein